MKGRVQFVAQGEVLGTLNRDYHCRMFEKRPSAMLPLKDQTFLSQVGVCIE